MKVQIEVDQDAYRWDEDDLEKESDCGQCPVCGEGGGVVPRGAGASGARCSYWKLQDAEDGNG